MLSHRCQPFWRIGFSEKDFYRFFLYTFIRKEIDPPPPLWPYPQARDNDLDKRKSILSEDASRRVIAFLVDQLLRGIFIKIFLNILLYKYIYNNYVIILSLQLWPNATPGDHDLTKLYMAYPFLIVKYCIYSYENIQPLLGR